MLTEIEFNEWKKVAQKSKYIWETKQWRFHDAPEAVQKNHELNIIAVIEGKDNLYQLHSDLQNSRDFMLEILEKEGTNNNYIHMQSIFQNDEEIIRRAFKNNCNIIKYAPRTTASEKKLIYELLAQNGLAYEHLSCSLMENPEICKIAAYQNPAAMQFMSKKNVIELCKDKDWVKKILNDTPSVFKFCSYGVRNNLLFAVPAIKSCPANLEFATDKIKDNKQWALELITNYDCSLYYLSENLQKDKQLIIERMKSNVWEFKYIPNDLQKDVHFVCEVIKVNKAVYPCLSESLQRDFKALSTLWQYHGDISRFYFCKNLVQEMKEMSLGDYVLRKRLLEKLEAQLKNKQAVPIKMNKFKI